MGIFDNFPYTNFHELNLDWILKMLQQIDKTMSEFVAINALKYANPIQWNITSQYEKNTIVIDPQTGTAYISVQPVPIGVILTNTDYWTVVFDLGSFVVRAAKNFTTRYEEATTLSATFSSVEGNWIVWGDTLYRALVNITAGDSYVVGSNITPITIEQVKNEVLYIFNSTVGTLTNLNTQDQSNIVAAINEVRSNLITSFSNITGRVEDFGATTATFNSIDGNWIIIGDTLYRANTTINIGDSYVIGTNINHITIEQVKNEVLNILRNTTGDLDNLLTTDKTNLVAAINEVFNLIIADPITFHNVTVTGDIGIQGELRCKNTSIYDMVTNKHIVYIGDSFSVAFLSDLEDYLTANGIDYQAIAVNGLGFVNSGYENQLANLTAKNECTDIYIQGGTNDTHSNYTPAQVSAAMASFKTAAALLFPNAKIHTLFTGMYTINNTNSLLTNNPYTWKEDYRLAALENGIDFVDMTHVMHCLPLIRDTDGVHPNTDGVTKLCQMIYQYIVGEEFDFQYTKTGSNTITITPATDVTSAALTIVRQTYTKSCTMLYSNGGTIVCNLTIPTASFMNVTIGTLEDIVPLFPYANQFMVMSGSALVTINDGTYRVLPVTIGILGKNVYLSLATPLKVDGTGFATGNITRIALGTCVGTFDLLEC